MVRRLDAAAEQRGGIWRVHLPVRREFVDVEKRLVVVERVRLAVQAVPDVARSTETLRREELVAERGGGVGVVERERADAP